MPAPPTWEANGTVRVPAFELPLPPGMSEEAKSILLKRAKQPAVSARSAFEAGTAGEAQWMEAMVAFRAGMETLHRRLLNQIQARYEADVTTTSIGGLKVDIVEPRYGIAPANRTRVLINLHGGAFVGGAEHCGLIESVPLACTAGIRVAVVDYRQGWEHRFPAASEDVAAVYEVLLRDYPAGSVGVFGYSAGGSLTSQALAWFDRHGLPMPGAAALCSAGAGGVAGVNGDSTYLAAAAMGETPPAVQSPTEAAQPDRFGYFAGIDPGDPLMSPLHDPGLMGRFPPTMLLTGTRSFDLSAAIVTHRALVNAGVTAQLDVFEGMWHCFPYNVALPEAQDALRALGRFFEAHLGDRPSP
jgi:monoterpene epsilon-lactone hydrolase